MPRAVRGPHGPLACPPQRRSIATVCWARERDAHSLFVTAFRSGRRCARS
jgi:hypothetical protein